MRSIESITNAEYQVERMLEHMGYSVGSREYARAEQIVDKLWAAEWAGVNADLKAARFVPPDLGARGQPGSSRENPIPLKEPKQVYGLAPGTWYLTSDGRVMQRQ